MEIVSPSVKNNQHKSISFDNIYTGDIFIDREDNTFYIKTDGESAVVLHTEISFYKCGEVHDGSDFDHRNLQVIHDAKLQTAFFDNK